MRKKYSIIFICLVMITLNAICLNWAIQQERMKELAVTTASDRKQILSLLLGNMQMHYTYSECQLPDIILIDKLKNEITLSSIIADKRKLVLKFSPQNCYPCIEFSMSCLEKFGGSRNLVGISIYLCQPKKKKLSVCHSMQVCPKEFDFCIERLCCGV